MIVRKFVVGPLANNCFIVCDEKSKECFVVDPGDEPDRMLDFLHENVLNVKYIICTHGHFDHVGAISDIKKATGASVVIHREDLAVYMSTREQAASWGFELDSQPPPDAFVAEGDAIGIGDLRFEVLHTPGHSPGGICLYGEGILITGDTLFAGSVGRTDFPGGDLQALKKSFKRLMSFTDDTKVLPGHGPESSIGKERTDNFFSHEYGE